MDVIPRLFSVDDVYRMLEAGILAEGERVELIEGELLALPPHDAPIRILFRTVTVCW